MATPSIIIEIKNRYSSMNPAMQQISNYLMENYQEAAFMGIHDLAKQSGVSAASVTGYVKDMGYKNYKSFQLAMAVSVGQNNGKEDGYVDAPFIYGNISEKDSMEEICRKVFLISIQMLTDTLSILDVDGLKKISELILKANRVIFLGVGRSYLTAESGKSRFYRMGINSFCYRDSHEQIVAAAMCDEGDVVIGVSNYGRTRSVVNALEIAKSHGAITVGVTSAKNSPLANIVDYPLYSASGIDNTRESTEAFEPSSENVAQIAILDCLYMYVAINKKESVLRKYSDTTHELERERV